MNYIAWQCRLQWWPSCCGRTKHLRMMHLVGASYSSSSLVLCLYMTRCTCGSFACVAIPSGMRQSAGREGAAVGAAKSVFIIRTCPWHICFHVGLFSVTNTVPPARVMIMRTTATTNDGRGLRRVCTRETAGKERDRRCVTSWVNSLMTNELERSQLTVTQLAAVDVWWNCLLSTKEAGKSFCTVWCRIRENRCTATVYGNGIVAWEQPVTPIDIHLSEKGEPWCFDSNT